MHATNTELEWLPHKLEPALDMGSDSAGVEQDSLRTPVAESSSMLLLSHMQLPPPEPAIATQHLFSGGDRLSDDLGRLSYTLHKLHYAFLKSSPRAAGSGPQ